jgi:MinD-like ATPase involved in chromosome partitioning or flagellar assembly
MNARLAGARDQADGLRRLLGPRVTAPRARLVNVISACSGAGRTTLVANLAACLRHLGRQVAVIDASRGRGTDGETLERALHAADFVLVDAAPGSEGCLRQRLPVRQEAILVTSASAQAITESYAWLKQRAGRHGDIEFALAVCRANTEHAARQAYANLRDVAARHLGLRVGFAGAVLHDAKIAQASLAASSVVATHPRSRAAAQLRALAERLDPRPPGHGAPAERPPPWNAPGVMPRAAAA